MVQATMPLKALVLRSLRLCNTAPAVPLQVIQSKFVATSLAFLFCLWNIVFLCILLVVDPEVTMQVMWSTCFVGTEVTCVQFVVNASDMLSIVHN